MSGRSSYPFLTQRDFQKFGKFLPNFTFTMLNRMLTY